MHTCLASLVEEIGANPKAVGARNAVLGAKPERGEWVIEPTPTPEPIFPAPPYSEPGRRGSQPFRAVTSGSCEHIHRSHTPPGAMVHCHVPAHVHMLALVHSLAKPAWLSHDGR